MSEFSNRIEDAKPLTREALEAFAAEMRRQCENYPAFLRQQEELRRMNTPIPVELLP